MLETLFYQVPAWLDELCMTVILLTAVEIGFRLGRRRQRAVAEPQKGQAGAIQAAILGLLALMLGFTFSVSQSRFDTRRQLVVEEANAIGTTYLRSLMLDEPQRDEVVSLLRQYAESRVPAPNRKAVADAIARSERLQQELWRQAISASRGPDNPATVALFVWSLNEMIDVHTKRVAAYLFRLPPAVLLVLHLAALMAGAVLGYASGLYGRRHFAAVVVMVLLLALTLLLILDLEQTQMGLIKVSHQSLIEVRQMME